MQALSANDDNRTASVPATPERWRTSGCTTSNKVTPATAMVNRKVRPLKNLRPIILWRPTKTRAKGLMLNPEAMLNLTAVVLE